MKVGMNLLLWTDHPKPSEHAGLIRQLKAWGFDGVEFPVQPMAQEDIAFFAELCEELGLGRTAILALDAGSADPASPDPLLREAAVREIVQAAEKTSALGSDLLCGPLFQGLGRFTGLPPTSEEWAHAVTTIRTAARQAALAGVRLALEPINRFEMYMVNTTADAARFVRDVGEPNVGLLVDSHHANIEEHHTAEAWRQVAEHIIHVHMSENHRGTPGSGQAIQPDQFALLHEIGYDGWLTIEAFSHNVPGLVSRLHLWRTPSAAADEPAVAGVRFLREALTQARR